METPYHLEHGLCSGVEKIRQSYSETLEISRRYCGCLRRFRIHFDTGHLGSTRPQSGRTEPALRIPMSLLREMLNRLEDAIKEISRMSGTVPRRLELEVTL